MTRTKTQYTAQLVPEGTPRVPEAVAAANAVAKAADDALLVARRDLDAAREKRRNADKLDADAAAAALDSGKPIKEPLAATRATELELDNARARLSASEHVARERFHELGEAIVAHRDAWIEALREEAAAALAEVQDLSQQWRAAFDVLACAAGVVRTVQGYDFKRSKARAFTAAVAGGVQRIDMRRTVHEVTIRPVPSELFPALEGAAERLMPAPLPTAAETEAREAARAERRHIRDALLQVGRGAVHVPGGIQ